MVKVWCVCEESKWLLMELARLQLEEMLQEAPQKPYIVSSSAEYIYSSHLYNWASVRDNKHVGYASSSTSPPVGCAGVPGPLCCRISSIIILNRCIKQGRVSS